MIALSTSFLAPEYHTTTPEYHTTTIFGMKRSVVIGIVCSVTVLLTGLLAFFATKRRRNISTQNQRCSDFLPQYLDNNEVWWQEKSPKIGTLPVPPQPPVEAATRPVHELDATPLPKALYRRKVLHSEELCNAPHRQVLPVLVVHPPPNCLNTVPSPLDTPLDTSLHRVTSIILSPPPDAHYRPSHYQVWNR